MKGANSTEFDPHTPYPVIDLLAEWVDRNQTVQRRSADSIKGGTMRLGLYPCRLEPNSLAMRAYGKKLIAERHRHRYEFNNTYLETLARAGLIASGVSPDGELVEIVELKNHPWFLGCQFHPEFRSKPMDPHPLFRDFIRASLARGGRKKEKKGKAGALVSKPTRKVSKKAESPGSEGETGEKGEGT
jgi:CTP synthase